VSSYFFAVGVNVKTASPEIQGKKRFIEFAPVCCDLSPTFSDVLPLSLKKKREDLGFFFIIYKYYKHETYKIKGQYLF